MDIKSEDADIKAEPRSSSQTGWQMPGGNDGAAAAGSGVDMGAAGGSDNGSGSGAGRRSHSWEDGADGLDAKRGRWG